MKVIGVLLLLASAVCAECEEDYQCDKGQFCYKTGYCVSCINCENYHRLQSEKWTCSKEPQNCGGCLSGYKEELLTEGQIRDTCVLVQSPQKDIAYPHYLYLIIGVGVGIFIALVIVSAGIYFCKVAREKEQNHNASCSSNHDESRAGFQRTSSEKNYLYERSEVPPSVPLLSPIEYDGNARIAEDVEHQFCYGNQKKCSILPIQAKPVDYPTNECSSCNDSTEEWSPYQDYEGTAEGGHISPPPLYDDSTLQCNWSPAFNNESTKRVIPYQDCSSSNNESTERVIPYQDCSSSNNESTEGVSHLDYKDTAEDGHISPRLLDDDSMMHHNSSPEFNYGKTPTTVDSDGNVMSPINEEVETLAGIDEIEETEHGEDEVSETNINLNDSGVSDNSCQASNSSLIHPFAHLGSTSTSSLQETRGVTRNHSEDDVSTRGTAEKRQRQDDTQSLDEGTVSDI